jgi:hypothetical protein
VWGRAADLWASAAVKYTSIVRPNSLRGRIRDSSLDFSPLRSRKCFELPKKNYSHAHSPWNALHVVAQKEHGYHALGAEEERGLLGNRATVAYIGLQLTTMILGEASKSTKFPVSTTGSQAPERSETLFAHSIPLWGYRCGLYLMEEITLVTMYSEQVAVRNVKGFRKVQREHSLAARHPLTIVNMSMGTSGRDSCS